MKKVLLYAGIIVCLVGLIPLVRYVFDYSQLSNYGKGYIWGKLLIIIIGMIMVLVSLRLKRLK